MRSTLRVALSALAVLLLVTLSLAPLRAAAAQTVASGPERSSNLRMLPYGPGEHAIYQVKLGGVSVGSGSMRVLGIKTVDGRPTYHTRFQISGGLPLARVDDTFESWIDVDGLFSRRFKQDQREISYRRKRAYNFFPELGTYQRTDTGETGTLPTDRPLDDVSFLYYARTLPLRVGETYTLPHYFKESGNPVVLKVLRKETVRVPAGTFRTIVVRPIIQTKGLFSEGGEAEVYFSDDERRVVVQMRSKVPVVGSLNLYLKEYREGEPHLPGSATRAGTDR